MHLLLLLPETRKSQQGKQAVIISANLSESPGLQRLLACAVRKTEQLPPGTKVAWWWTLPWARKAGLQQNRQRPRRQQEQHLGLMLMPPWNKVAPNPQDGRG